MFLFINTATTRKELVLFEKGRILISKTWTQRFKEAEKVAPLLKLMLEKTEATWADLKRIYVVTGPGGFTALRVGITVANTLAFLLKIPVYALNTFQYWQMRNQSIGADVNVLIEAGLNKVYWHNPLKQESRLVEFNHLIMKNPPTTTPDGAWRASLIRGARKKQGQTRLPVALRLQPIGGQALWEPLGSDPVSSGFFIGELGEDKIKKLQKAGANWWTKKQTLSLPKALLINLVGNNDRCSLLNLKPAKTAQPFYLQEPKITKGKQ